MQLELMCDLLKKNFLSKTFHSILEVRFTMQVTSKQHQKAHYCQNVNQTFTISLK